MSLPDFQLAFGIALSPDRDAPAQVSIATTNRGFRDCEVLKTVLFEYHDRNDATRFFRIMTHEFRDVTETRRVEQALIAARDRALRQADLRGEFFAKLSHELRTPLNAIVGISSLLVERSDELDPRIRKRLMTLYQASGHMEEMIDMSLRNAECVHALDNLLVEPVALHDLVDEIIGILSLQANMRQIELRNEIPEDLLFPTEPRAMRQLLLNLMSNAVKYNVPNGRVTVRSLLKSPGFLTLSLIDTGIGMTGDQVENCMRPYTRYGEGQGSGLGLSISSHLITAMGGFLTLTSEKGRGTTVNLQLPLDATRQIAQDTRTLVTAMAPESATLLT